MKRYPYPIAYVQCDCCSDRTNYKRDEFDGSFKYEKISGQVMCEECQKESSQHWTLQLEDITDKDVNYEEYEPDDYTND